MYKNINIYVSDIDNKQELLLIASKYNKVKDYVYSRYNGINSILTIQNSNKLIRDEWTKSGFIDDWNISRRYVRSAIEDAITNIKTNLINTKARVRKDLYNLSTTLTKEEKHFINYVLKSNILLHEVLTTKQVTVDKFNDLDKPKLIRLINRLYRKNYPSKSKSKAVSIKLDQEMYTYKDNTLYITGLIKGKRLELTLNTLTTLTGNIRISIKDNKIIVSKSIKQKIRQNLNENIIGIDKNFVNTFDTNTNNSYGLNLNKIQMKYTNLLSDKDKKRNYYYDLIKKNKKLTDKIKRNNLGHIKRNRVKNKLKEELKKHINLSVKELIKNEKPKEIVVEDLSFVYKTNKPRTKKVKLYLSTWMKGYIDERLGWYCELNNIILTKINAAYTSQVCSECGCFGNRIGDNLHFPCGRVVNAGFEAGRNILARKYDADISLYTPYLKVKNILNKRLVDKTNLCFTHELDKPNQPRPAYAGANYNIEYV